MTLPIFIAGVLLVLIALLTLVFFVVAPPVPRVAVERRRAPGIEYVSTLTRVTDRTTRAIDNAFARRGSRLFGPQELELAGIKAEPSGFVVIVASFAAVLALIGVVLGFQSGWAPVFAILGALLAPLGAKVLLSVLTARRRAVFADQLDDTVQMMASNLRAGHGLMRAIDAVSRDAEAPTSEELARVVNEARLGRDISESLAVTTHRMQSDDFDWVAQAIGINRETGGNLAEVLDHVGGTIRERNQIRRQVKALSAEGRLSGVILILLPVGVLLFLLLVQPAYLTPFFTNVIGIVALIIAAILMVIGTIWMMITVRVKF